MATALNDGLRALTVPDVAERMGVSTRKVWTLISMGELKTFKVGARGTRILSSALDEYLNKLAASAGTR